MGATKKAPIFMSAQPPYNIGPLAPERNPPINPQYYAPSQFFISTVTLGISTTVTTTVNHNYYVGQQVRLIIPPTFGCRQLNESQGIVTSIPALNQVIVGINSVGADAFTSSASTTQPQILAIGDINSGQINSSGLKNQLTYIPGSFIDISPL